MQGSALINVMTGAARKAARGLLRDFGEVENLQVSKKGPGDFVTAADHRVEKVLVQELKRPALTTASCWKKAESSKVPIRPCSS